MADDVDMSQESYERFLNHALAGRLNQPPVRESLTNCEECGSLIPEGRRKAQPGCTRCVRCQNELETEILAHWRN